MKARPEMMSAHDSWRWVTRALLALLAVRLVSLGLYPVMDNTEARYAEIGRAMVSLNDWVTPWIEPGVPFWGKPPLSFWITATSEGLFGMNEFAARLPHFLMALLTGWVIWGWARSLARDDDQPVALMAVSLLAGACLMGVAAGAVMTDMSLVAGTTLAMRGFWQGLHSPHATQRRALGWLFFLGLAIGLLAKGPLVLVLAGMPLGLWTMSQRQLLPVWRGLPWVGGTALMLALALPWYVVAEMHSPGFLNYFLVGEHWHRFVTAGWSGDRYGGAHAVPRGIIWGYALVATLPWSALLPIAAWRWRRLASSAGGNTRTVAHAGPSLVRYLAFWSLTPLVFFTFAGNILWTYVLPSLPPLALMGGLWLATRAQGKQVPLLLAAGLATTTLALVAFVVVLNQPQYASLNNTRVLVAQATATGQPLYFYPQRPYSALFYSRGSAGVISDTATLNTKLTNQSLVLALKTETMGRLPPDALAHLQAKGSFGDYTLLASRP